MDRINTLARALVFCCTAYDDNDEDNRLSKLASDNPIHGNQWPDQRLARDTTRMLHTFCNQYAKQWARFWKPEKEIDWHEVGMVLAATGCGYDAKGQERELDTCKQCIREVWAGYAYSATWRLTKRGSLALDCIPPQTPNGKVV